MTQIKNHIIFILFAALFTFLFSSIFIGCKKDKQVPEVNTFEITSITENSATCGGEVISEGDAKVTAYGICWSKDHPPTIADAKTNDGERDGSFSSCMNGLDPFSTYYVRAYATNRHGTGYGNTRTFKTLYNGEIVTDYDGNIYHTVTIGTQVWMVENLRVTHFRNGVPITLETDTTQWENGYYYPEYCYYNNDTGNISTFGLLYNQTAVLDSNGLAPAGWHIAHLDEFNALINYLGGENVAGGKLKESGTAHWPAPNIEATNLSGFTALPGGRRIYKGKYEGAGSYANFWTSYPSWMLELSFDNSKALMLVCGGSVGASVRCIKD